MNASETVEPRTDEVLDSMFGEVYNELRDIARVILRAYPPNQTLQPTVLVHEAYLRLVQSYRGDGLHRGHFFAAAAQAMRRILIEDARRKLSQRRGGHWSRVPLDQVQAATDAHPELLLAINEALEGLAAEYPERAEAVELIFFGGLTAEEAGEVMHLCERTVKRHWAFARAWLYQELSAEGRPGTPPAT
jgi:RNA polymerase sigma factor (TIGR02999 family)